MITPFYNPLELPLIARKSYIVIELCNQMFYRRLSGTNSIITTHLGLGFIYRQ